MQRNRIFGAVLGEAIGDAIGHPIEDKWAGTEDKQVDGLLDDNKFTDDTQMFCAIGEAMLASPPHESEEKFMVTLSEKFEEWRKNPLGGSHRAPGGNCMESVRKLGAGISWRKAGGLDYKGNGTAMRSGIVGCMYWQNPEFAFRIGCLTSVPTHNNLEPILAAGTVAYLVAAQIKGFTFNEAVANVLILCADYNNPYRVPLYPREVKIGSEYHDQNPTYAVALFGAAYALGQTPTVDIKEAVHALQDPSSVVRDGAAVPAVAEAIFFNSLYGEGRRARGSGQFDERFSDTVITAANNSDDTDTIAAISGCIMGARLGASNIPSEWTAKIELSDYLHNLAERIWGASSASFDEPLKPKDAVNMANPEIVGVLLAQQDFLDEDLTDEDNRAFGVDAPIVAGVGDDNEDYEVEF